jgi:PhnB protein
MAIKTLNPYLNFDGTANDAIKLHESALGAKVENVQRFGDVKTMPCPPGSEQRVMHAHLVIGGGAVMISDGMPGMPIERGNNMHVTLHFDDPKEMDAKFDALAAGGQVTMPLQDTFWGARFGMLTDAYGIRWMFSAELRG